MSRKQKSFFPKRHAVPEPSHPDSGKMTQDNGWVRLRLTADLLSDAHLGSGSGSGGIDALVARDRRGHPVIWASHVEGVLRDAARRLHGDKRAEAFFGRGGGDYARGDRQRAVFTSLYANDNPQSRIWRSTAREAFDNRAPKGETLRVVEYAPKGTKFSGEVELPASELPNLQRLVREVDALGGGRATGAGRVKLTLTESPITSRKVGAATGRLLLLLKNRDPLCVTATATPDNLIPSLAFVPGRTLLGAFTAWLIGEGDRETASLLTCGSVSVSDATPLPQTPTTLESVEVLPSPLSLQSEKPKGSAGEVPWWAHANTPIRRLDGWVTKKDQKLKRPDDDLFVYRAAEGDAWTTFRPARRVRLRNGRSDPNQTDKTDTSLFAIEQIVEETHFLTELQGTVEDLKRLADRLGPILAGRRWLRVGRAGAPVEVAQFAWAGAASPAKVAEKVLLTLTSDLLVRDDYLRWRTGLDEVALRALLAADDLQLGKSLQDSVIVHGFNGTSRLWRMPSAAIRRGSVFEISGAGIAKLAQRAASGDWLGERTHEGFGRFRLDTSLPGVTGEAHAPSEHPATADGNDETVASTTQRWFGHHKRLAEPSKAGDRKPSLSQWLDLVSDLERRETNAIENRLNPTTAGARGWKHEDAEMVLRKLEALQPEQRAPHAQFFVRWLRAKLRTNRREGAA